MLVEGVRRMVKVGWRIRNVGNLIRERLLNDLAFIRKIFI